MIERLTRTLVTFLHPFQLDESGEVFPAGAYAIETEESWGDGDSFHAAQNVSTVMVVRPQPQELVRRNRYLSIKWASLAAAIAHRVRHGGPLIGPPSNLPAPTEACYGGASWRRVIAVPVPARDHRMASRREPTGSHH